MTYRVTIDQTLCSGFGTCATARAGRLRSRRRHRVRARRRDRRPRSVLERGDACPMGAISVELEEAA